MEDWLGQMSLPSLNQEVTSLYFASQLCFDTMENILATRMSCERMASVITNVDNTANTIKGKKINASITYDFSRD